MGITAIWGSPHSGKTEIAIALARMLARNGAVVCLISAQNYAEMAGRLEVYDERGLLNAISSDDNITKFAVEVKKEKGLFLIAATPSDSVLDLVFTKEQAGRLLHNALSNFQHVIVDCSNIKAITGEAVALAEKVIIPIPAISTTNYWHAANDFVLHRIKDKTIFVRNCTAKAFTYIEHEKALGCTPSCAIPYCKDMSDLMAHGMGLLEGGSKICDAIELLAQEVTTDGRE